MTSSKSAGQVKASSEPIESFNTGLAQSISHLHPLFILVVYRYQFNALVQDPIRQLLNSLPLLSILQTIYVMACFTPAPRNGSAALNRGSKSSQRNGHRNTKGGMPVSKHIVVRSFTFCTLRFQPETVKTYHCHSMLSCLFWRHCCWLHQSLPSR